VTRTKDSKIAMLRQVPRLRGRPDKELARLAAFTDVCTFGPETVLAVEGSHGAEAMILVEGTAEVSIGGRPVAEIGPGEFACEMAMVDRGRRTATVKTVTEVTALVIGPQAIHAVLDNTAMVTAMLEGVVARMRKAQRYSEAVTDSP
jgi:CRP-like cAMP-binding protein